MLLKQHLTTVVRHGAQQCLWPIIQYPPKVVRQAACLWLFVQHPPTVGAKPAQPDHRKKRRKILSQMERNRKGQARRKLKNAQILLTFVLSMYGQKLQKSGGRGIRYPISVISD